jgi:hypothetical protein
VVDDEGVLEVGEERQQVADDRPRRVELLMSKQFAEQN